MIGFCCSLNEQNIRVDIDDRNDSIGKRIRDAEKEWIRYIIVIGEKELKGGIDGGHVKFNVRDRNTSDVRELTLVEFTKEIEELIKNKPFSKLNSPILLSQRPQIMV